MKKVFRYFAAAMCAAGLFSCVELETPNDDQIIAGSGEKVKLILNASKGETKSSPDTKVYVGQVANGKVRYYWNENDQIGVIPLNVTDSKPNYVTTESQINPGNKNQAQFESYIQADGYSTAEPNLLIYYPYNSSMLEGTSGSNGQAYAKSGLTFRLPQQQEQYGYSRTFVGENASEVNEHPSVWALSHYGLAYDLAGSTQVKEEIDGVSVSNLRGDFTLDHANTYFQFNVWGSKSDGVNSKDYGDGTWKVASVALEAGCCVQSTDEKTGEPVFTLNNQVSIAGTYKFTYTYSSSHFSNGAAAGTNNNSNISLSSVAPVNSVRVTMNNIDSAPALGRNADEFVPAFAVINAAEIKSNPKRDLNCLKVSVTCYKYEDGKIVGSDTRTRFYNISSIVGTDISGNYYTIDFEVCDPVESYTDLSALNSANCYVISAPGNYTFNADVAGNGKLPHGTTGSTIMGVDPKNLMQDGKKYAIDWLWASGLSFDAVKSGNMTDADVVGQIVNNVALTGDNGQISIGLAAGSTLSTLSGNVVLALYEVGSNGSVGNIVWTWHLWLGRPEAMHFKFPATTDAFEYTNEHWYMLDRNIGAETNTLGNPRSTGLFYQRGRKEPIIGFGDAAGSTTWTSNQIRTYRNTAVFGTKADWKANVAYSAYNTLSEPMSLVNNIPYGTSSPYYYAWNAATEVSETSIANDVKSMFDPCPAGYRLPTTREWDNFKNVEFKNGAGNELASGVFGYCFLKKLEGILNTANATDRVIAERIAAGNYYEVNDQFERTYYISEYSGTGSPITINFPNSGVLYANGTMDYLYQEDERTPVVSYTIPAGPEVDVTVSEGASGTINAPQLTGSLSYSSWSGYFTLSGVSGNLYYSVGVDNPATTTYLTRNYRVYTSTTTSGRINADLSSSKTEEKVYLYYKDSNGNVSNPTIVTVKRQSSSSYTATYTNGSEKSITAISANVTFKAGTGTYYYSVNNGSSRLTVNNASKLTVGCGALTYERVGSTYQAKLYVYSKATVSGKDYYPQTVITLQRTGTSTYSVVSIEVGPVKTIQTGGEVSRVITEAALAMWSAGRVEGTNYQFFWFGPMRDLGDGWHSGKSPSFSYDKREYYEIGYAPYGMRGIQDPPTGSGDTNGARGAATVARCIREYDNISTVVVSE